ncbi:hypothetical protein MCAP1_002257 [Malassezia caprae]|uniref:TEA domain-containing protein n=1 Tax=Malassezia caprae TaxID=1381934 RepID=A0AAF0E9C5_9BASI|nr:hypothetical protein MCAP1_002257 [Malassezia caprae]
MWRGRVSLRAAQLHTSVPRANGKLFQTILHGEGEADALSHKPATDNYVYEVQRTLSELMSGVAVKPEHVVPYKQAVENMARQVDAKYGGAAEHKGSFEVMVGDMGHFYHIWRYTGYEGFDKISRELRSDPMLIEHDAHIAPMLQHRRNWLTQAFTFWQNTELALGDGVYELRTYQLQPGRLLEWERIWRQGLEARRPFTEPLGAWFSRLGELHQVFHLWKFDSMEDRARIRAAAWQVEPVSSSGPRNAVTPGAYMGIPPMGAGLPPSGLELDHFSSPMTHSVSETGVDGAAALSPTQLRHLPMGTMPGPMASPVPVTMPAAPLSGDGKRRRMSPPTFSSPVRPEPTSSPYGMMMPQAAGPNGSMYFAPSMLSFNLPESPSPSSSADMALQGQPLGANLSPLAHRTALRTASASGTSPSSMSGPGLPGPSYQESPVMRRANSYGGVSAPWPTRDQMGLFHGPGMSSPTTTSPHMGPPISAPLMMQRQYSSPQPRASRERSTRQSTTDVWPDDVEVAFWEALRLIPKLGRRKVLVHGKPCGRNELIADYIERKTGKMRSRKQVSSHIQVLKNVKRGDLEFQQLIAEPTSEEDYYTPAGGMMYAHTLAEYSMGLLGFSLTPSSTDVLPSPMLSASASLSPAVSSPLPPSHSPAQSPATGLISNALDNMHMTSPSPNPATRVLPPTGVRQTSPAQLVPLHDLEPFPTFMPTAFSLWAYSSKSDDRHHYTSLDTLAMSKILQTGSEVPVLPSNGPTATSFRFPRLAEMHRQMSCPFVHVHVPLTLPRAEPTAPMYDRLGVALSMGSTQNTPLSVVLSIYSHGKCVLTLVERLEAPRPLARGRPDSSRASGDEALQRSPAPGEARYAWAYQVPFATDFWADFLSRNHSQRLFQGAGAPPDVSYCKEPSERASVGMAVAGVAFVQEFVVPHKDAPHGPQPTSPASDSVSPGSRLGDVVGVLAWEFECVESASREPGTPRVSVLGAPMMAGAAPSAPALQTPHRAAPASVPQTPASPTLGGAARSAGDRGLLGLQLQPKRAASPTQALDLGVPPRGEAMGRTMSLPATTGRTDASRPSAHRPMPDDHFLRPSGTPPPMPTLIRTQASPLAATGPAKVDEQGENSGAAPSAPREAAPESVPLPGQDKPPSPLKPSSQFVVSPETAELGLRLGTDLYPSAGMAPGMSTLSPAMMTSDLLTPQGLGFMPPGGGVVPQRSHSMSMLNEQDPDLPQPSSMQSASISALTDSMPSNLETDASGRWGLSGAVPWAGQQDLMDAFLNSSMMESTHFPPASPTITHSFSPEPGQGAPAPALDVALPTAL